MPIRPLESRDIDSILAIQSACPEIAQWKSADYDRVVHGEMSGWIFETVAETPHVGNIAGFLVARHVAHEIEILNFAIRPDARRHGSGAALLECALSWARTLSAEQANLEVRSANATALRFYDRHQFQIVGRRRNYYVAPNDDALLLSRRLT